MPCVVADTSPLFYLARLGRLALLRDLYQSVNLPPAVWSEALAGGRSYPEILPHLQSGVSDGWLVLSKAPRSGPLAEAARLDEGEREAILLACEIHADLLIVDEQIGRGVAERLGLVVTGTLGVLAEAKNKGLILSLRDELIKLRCDTTFRFSPELEKRILSLAGESPDI
jgi:uncharacterized protein